MIEIIRKSFTPKKLAFLVTFALLSQGFCVNSFAGTTGGADANTDAAVYSGVEDYQVAGNAGTEDSSSQEGEKVAIIALSENTDLLTADKSNEKISDADSDISLNDSIPGSDDAFDSQNKNNAVESTYDDAIRIVEFESSIILEDASVSGSSLEVDELSSGSASEIGEETTQSDDETETTTEKGRSSRRGSLGNGKSSGNASKDSSDNKKGDSSSDTSNNNNSEKIGNDDPDRKSTDTPDASIDRSNDDNHSNKNEGTDPNGNGLNGNDDPARGNKDLENENLPGADNDDDSANNGGKGFVGADSAANGAHSSNMLPQTGSAMDTGTITLCGLALTAIGILLAKKKQKA